MIAERSCEIRSWLKWFAGLFALSALGCGSDAASMSDASSSMQKPSFSAMMSASPGSASMGKTASSSAASMSAMAPASSGGSAGRSSVSTASGSAGASSVSVSMAAAGGNTAAADGGGSGAQSAAAGGGGLAAKSGSAGAAEQGAAGSAGSAMSATSAAAGSGAAGDGELATHEDLGKGDGHDVVLIGDSWMSNTLQVEGTGGGLAPSLQSAAGQPYRNYGVQGVMLLSADTFGPAIPSQWDTAKAVNPDIKTVVMTGGGNDVIQNPGLQSDCKMNGDQCKMFRKQLLAALDKLWTQMAADGVKDVVYVRYSSNAGGGNNSGGMMMPPPDPQDMTVPVCLTNKISCHALDTNDLVMNDLAADGIHPLVTANGRMAKAIVDMMEKTGMRR